MTMRAWRAMVVHPYAPVSAALPILDAHQIALVIRDHDETLLGTITDGDVRRALLAGNGVDVQAEIVMRRHPVVTGPDATDEDALALMRSEKVRRVTVVDSGRLLGVRFLEDLTESAPLPNLAVVMAGGRGERLRPLTDKMPKPLVYVGPGPILDTIVDGLARAGFSRVCFVLRYLGGKIRKRYGRGAHGVEFSYVTEDRPLGTAGGLAFVQGACGHPMLVTNGDVLTRCDYRALMEFHGEAHMTVAITDSEIEVPFGVPTIVKDEITDFQEKPTLSFPVAAGIYVVNPAVVTQWLAPGAVMDMPDLIRKAIGIGSTVRAFPIHEYWTDIGRPNDLAKARDEYGVRFGDGT